VQPPNTFPAATHYLVYLKPGKVSGGCKCRRPIGPTPISVKENLKVEANMVSECIDRELEFYEFFSFVKYNEFYEFFFG